MDDSIAYVLYKAFMLFGIYVIFTKAKNALKSDTAKNAAKQGALAILQRLFK